MVTQTVVTASVTLWQSSRLQPESARWSVDKFKISSFMMKQGSGGRCIETWSRDSAIWILDGKKEVGKKMNLGSFFGGEGVVEEIIHLDKQTCRSNEWKYWPKWLLQALVLLQHWDHLVCCGWWGNGYFQGPAKLYSTDMWMHFLLSSVYCDIMMLSGTVALVKKCYGWSGLQIIKNLPGFEF